MDLDPSQPKFPSGVGAKMAIDATIGVGAGERLVQFPKEQVDYVRNRWSAYGFEDNPSVGDKR